jgi:arylsulfatase A-like enzyme
MERLRAMGVQFTNAYSTPVCSPTRVSLMTGMNAARHRVTNWTLRPDQMQPMELNHPDLIFPKWNYNGMSTSDSLLHTAVATPLAEILRKTGYFTIHAGKAHFGAIGYPSSNPKNIGFDINIAGHAAGAPASYLGTENFGNDDEERKVWAVPGLEKYHGKDIFLTQALTQEALTAVRKPLTEKQPFFLYLSLYGVHTPLMADDRFINPYLDQGLPQAEARYASMIESMDKALGDVLDFVEKQKIEKETIILFMSDNGGLSAVARAGKKHIHNAPLQSGKGSIYEGGIRVPMLAYWPGVTLQNDQEETPVIIEDFYPSLLEIAGVVQPETIQKIDGKSFVPLLRGENYTLKDRPLFWHYPNDWGPEGPGIGSFSAIRKGDWKLIYFHEDSHFELYDLIKDISETKNLAQHKSIIRDSLAILLTQHLMDVDAQLPIHKSTQKVIPYPAQVLN